MKNKKFSLIAATIMTLLWTSQGYSLSEDTHKAINEYVAKNTVGGFSLTDYLINNLGFDGGATDEISGDANGVIISKSIYWWLGYGGVQEDRPGDWFDYLPWRISRSLNHFHNPLKTWPEAGLNDIYSGQSSILWAQNANQDPGGNLGGNWSWQNARIYYYIALTGKDFDGKALAATKTDRDGYFAKTLRAIGQQMHLVEDASVPEHVRNDSHILPGYEKYVEREIRLATTGTLWSSLIGSSITFDKKILDIPSSDAGAPVPIARIIDADQYVETSPGEANPEITKTLDNQPQVVGISEYANANFLSRNTIFNRTDAKHNFPYPRPEDTILKLDSINNREYLQKTTSGDVINHLAIQSIVHNVVNPEANVEKRLTLDSECYKEAAQHLIPRAVGYSAGLLNYFFRGNINLVDPAPDSSPGQFSIKNNSNENMSGTFSLYCSING